MRNNIKNILKELEEEGWREEYLTDDEIKKLDKLLKKDIGYIKIILEQDSYTQYNIIVNPLLYTPGETIMDEFWRKYDMEEYYVLQIDISIFKKLVMAGWRVHINPDKRKRDNINVSHEELWENTDLYEKYVNRWSETPPNEECKILLDKIIKILEQEGFIYVTPEECNEEFNGKKLYDILFAYI